ncbi:MAG: 1-acyl-sn-glycerol-3-phosphate acyltransferase [Oscillospiraceae bacterium]|nr:1-acyl-sn-glycerol-3-phosphate acyltransferase [Oscillospiraceae bacterium]
MKKILVTILVVVMITMRKYKIINKENLPKDDGFIIVLNHRDYWDLPLVISIMGSKRSVHPLVKVELEKQLAGRVLGFMGAVFVNRKDPEDRKLARLKLVGLVLNGSNVLICPEGTRNKTDALLLPFAGCGAVSIAQTTGRPIVPFAISRYGTKNRQRFIRICNPFYVGAEDDLDEANNRLRTYLYDALLENTRLQKG